MGHQKKTKRIFWLAAFVVGGGAVYEISTEETSVLPERVALSAETENHLKGATVSRHQPSPNFEQAATPHKPSLDNLGKRTLSGDENEKADKTPASDNTKLARYFYDMYLHSSSARAKMDNLRWVCEVFADDPTPDVMAKVAAALEIDKGQFVKIITDTANAFFKEAATTPTTTYSRYDHMTFWNDLRLSFPYTGLSADGEYKESLAQSSTGYTYQNLVRARDAYVVSATAEIIKDVSVTATRIEKEIDSLIQKNLDNNAVWRQALDSISLKSRMDLRDKLYLINFVLDNRSSSLPRSDMAAFGINPVAYDAILFLNEPLNGSIVDGLQEAAKRYEQSPAKSGTQAKTPDTNNGQVSFPDIVHVFSRPLFYTEPK